MPRGSDLKGVLPKGFFKNFPIPSGNSFFAGDPAKFFAILLSHLRFDQARLPAIKGAWLSSGKGELVNDEHKLNFDFSGQEGYNRFNRWRVGIGNFSPQTIVSAAPHIRRRR